MAKRNESPAKLAALLKATSGELITRILRSHTGQKDLVLEASLIPALDLIIGNKRIQETGVRKIYKLEPLGPPVDDQVKCIYLARCTPKNTRTIATHVRHNNQNGKTHLRYTFICVPRLNPLCDRIIESEGVYANIEFAEYPLGLLPMDTDLYSFELPFFFTDAFLNESSQDKYTVALGLANLEKLCGENFGQIVTIGSVSQDVVKLFKLLTKTRSIPGKDDPIIDRLFILDRSVDFAALFLTPLNYLGLLDQYIGIENGCVKLKIQQNNEKTGPREQEVRLSLNTSDSVFCDIRDCHFANVPVYLKEQSQKLHAKSEERSNMKLTDIKRFIESEINVIKQHHRSVALHINASETIVKSNGDLAERRLLAERSLLDGGDIREAQAFLEEIIGRQVPVYTALRLMCLLSISQDGVPSKEYAALRQSFLQSYGYDFLVLLHNLRKLGLFDEQVVQASGTGMTSMQPTAMVSSVLSAGAGKVAASFGLREGRFAGRMKRLGLVPTVVDDLRNPKDPSFVFNCAYTPVAARIVDQVIQKGQNYEDTLKCLEMPTSFCGTTKNSSALASSNTIAVMLLGGCTYAEVSALRHMGHIKGYRVIVLTTSMVNGATFLKQLTVK